MIEIKFLLFDESFLFVKKVLKNDFNDSIHLNQEYFSFQQNIFNPDFYLNYVILVVDLHSVYLEAKAPLHG